MLEAQEGAAEQRYGHLIRKAGKMQDQSTMSEEQAGQMLNQMVRKHSGDKSMNIEELENMSDAELEALARKAAKEQ